MTRKRVTEYVKSEVERRLRAGQSQAQVMREMGVGGSTVNPIAKNIAATLEVPGLNDPTDYEKRVAVEMTHDQFLALGGRGETVMTAAMIQQDSLKQRMLKVIAETGSFPGVPELMTAVRESGPGYNGFGPHEVTHLLYSLNKSGLITFKGSRRGTASSLITDIRITDRGYGPAGYPVPGKSPENKMGAHPPGWSRPRHAVGKDYTEVRYHGPRAQGGEIETRSRYVRPEPTVSEIPSPAPAPAPAPTAIPPDDAAFPLLRALRESFATRAAADAKAARFTEAAALLEQDDPEEAERLLAKAVALAPASLSELEREYLRYAEEHGKGEA